MGPIVSYLLAILVILLVSCAAPVQEIQPDNRPSSTAVPSPSQTPSPVITPGPSPSPQASASSQSNEFSGRLFYLSSNRTTQNGLSLNVQTSWKSSRQLLDGIVGNEIHLSPDGQFIAFYRHPSFITIQDKREFVIQSVDPNQTQALRHVAFSDQNFDTRDVLWLPGLNPGIPHQDFQLIINLEKDYSYQGNASEFFRIPSLTASHFKALTTFNRDVQLRARLSSPDWTEGNNGQSDKLVFSMQSEDNSEIFVLSNVTGRDGSEPYQPVNLTRHPGYDTHPRWSPDGQKILFVSNRGYSTPSLCLMNPDGSQIDNLTRAVQDLLSLEADSLQWSPDGRAILFKASDARNASEKNIYTIEVESLRIRNLTREHESLGLRDKVHWSPDGKWIAYVFENDIYLTRPDGSNKIKLTQTADSWKELVGWLP